MKQRETEKSPDREKKIKRVEKSVLSVLLALVLFAVAFVAGWFGRWGALGKKKQELLWAIDAAQDNYYREIDEDKLFENLFSAFEFDPYSTYYTEEEYKTIAAERDGKNRDAGFSVFGQESRLEVYAVTGGSSAETAEIASGMRFLKFGKTVESLQTGDAEDYFAFVSKLATDEKYFVQCKDGEAEAVNYEVKNGADGAGIALTRKFDPMRVYQVVGNSPADRVKLKRGMYIFKYGANANVEEMVSGSSDEFFAFVQTLEPVKENEQDKVGTVTIHMLCGFEKDGSDADVYSVKMEEYRASYCTYRDKKEACRFKTVVKSDKKETLEKSVIEDGALSTLDDKTAYISLTEFTGNAAKEFKECLRIMKENKRTNLILDLRGNGGGYMDVFVEIASCLLRDAGSGAQKVAYAKFRNGAEVSYSASRSSFTDYFEKDSHVSVLADEYTASASECLIGALVDYNTVTFSDIYLHENENGVARTYGKGIMQTHYENSNGGTLKITSADIFWPKSDKTIHGVGVTPLDGAVAIASSLLPDANDSFLQAAVEKIKNKADAPTTGV